MGPVDIYHDSRLRLTTLLRAVSDEEAATPVPACPGWTVHDVAAHLAGVVTDVLEGRTDGIATDPWTAAQVEARRHVPLPDLLDEWERGAPAFEQRLAAAADLRSVIPAAVDVSQHEQDVRGALGRPGGRNSAGMDLSLQAGLGGLGGRIREQGWPALRVVAAGGADEWLLGDGEPAATLTADRFELARALFGRRSPGQVRGYRWEGGPEPWIGRFSVFGPAATDVAE